MTPFYEICMAAIICYLVGSVAYSFVCRCKAIMADYESRHNAPIPVDDDTVSLINVETKLQSIFNEQKTKFAKVMHTCVL
jgi:hypothetical protein